MTISELTDKLSDAIAYAEGFFVTGSRSQRNNNPGDLTVDLTGTGIGFDGAFVIYATAYDGWDALKKQVFRMIDGSSAFYNPSMSILEIAMTYTSTQQETWANNVASRLGVDIDATLNDLLDSPGTLIGGTAIVALLGLLYFMRRK